MASQWCCDYREQLLVFAYLCTVPFILCEPLIKNQEALRNQLFSSNGFIEVAVLSLRIFPHLLSKFAVLLNSFVKPLKVSCYLPIG